MHSFLPRIPLAVAPALLALSLTACGGGGSGPATASAAGGDSATNVAAAASPAALMDLSGWKLNLPVDANGGTGGSNGVQFGGRTVLPQELVAGFSDDYFRIDGQGRIVFTAPANGAVTTPGVGTDHTRSELREFDRSGDAKGDWTGSGTLSATCEVQQVATASPVAVIGQLRSENHVFAQLVYRVASQDIAVDVYQSDSDASRHAVTVLAAGLALGQPVAYALSFNAGVLTASVDGASRDFTVDGSWSSAPLYFKVGAYHLAPNVGNPAGDRTTVACAGISVTH
jgi:hypothetical protein